MAAAATFFLILVLRYRSVVVCFNSRSNGQTCCLAMVHAPHLPLTFRLSLYGMLQRNNLSTHSPELLRWPLIFKSVQIIVGFQWPVTKIFRCGTRKRDLRISFTQGTHGQLGASHSTPRATSSFRSTTARNWMCGISLQESPY